MSSNGNGAKRPPFSRAVRAGRIGARRPVFTLVSALVIAVALALLSSGAVAASKCEPLSTTTFTDPTGDGVGANAPDITSVGVTTYEEGWLSFQVALPTVSAFGDDMLVQVYVDSDKNAATGDASGFEYMLDVQKVQNQSSTGVAAPVVTKSLRTVAKVKCEDQPTVTLFKWNGSAWARVDAHTLSTSFGGNTLTVKLSVSELANTVAFNFAVYAAANVTFDSVGSPNLASASFDWAPDTGSYSYEPYHASTYTDPSGDGQGPNAPDLTQLSLVQWASGLIKLEVPLPGTPEFGTDMLVQVLIDSDRNPATGDENGYDYLIQVRRPPAAVTTGLIALRSLASLKCEDLPYATLYSRSEMGWEELDTKTLNVSYSGGLKLAINASELGGVTAFDFAVYAATGVSFDAAGSPVLTSASFDRAPDTGSFNFPLAVAAAQLQGVYKVRYHVISSHNFGDMKRGTVTMRTWKFVPLCKEGACTTKVVVAGGLERFRLSHKGHAVYKATSGRRYDCNASRSARGTEKIRLQIKKGAWVKGTWRVIKWVGTVRVVSPNNRVRACGGAASYTATLNGTLK